MRCEPRYFLAVRLRSCMIAIAQDDAMFGHLLAKRDERVGDSLECPRFFPERLPGFIALSGESEQFGYAKTTDGKNVNWMVVEKSAVIKFDKHVASRVSVAV